MNLGSCCLNIYEWECYADSELEEVKGFNISQFRVLEDFRYCLKRKLIDKIQGKSSKEFIEILYYVHKLTFFLVPMYVETTEGDLIQP